MCEDRRNGAHAGTPLRLGRWEKRQKIASRPADPGTKSALVKNDLGPSGALWPHDSTLAFGSRFERALFRPGEGGSIRICRIGGGQQEGFLFFHWLAASSQKILCAGA